MKLATPIDQDQFVSERVKFYEDAIRPDGKFPPIANPADHKVPGVEYDSIGMPVMPTDVTALDSRSLGQLFQAMEAWHSYFNDLTTEAFLEKHSKEDIVGIVRAKVKKELREGGASIKDVDELFKLDMRYIEADSNFLKARAQYERAENYRAMVARRFTLISREITRRGEDNRVFSGDPDKRFSGHRPQTNEQQNDEFGSRRLK